MFSSFSKTDIVGIMETIEAAHDCVNEAGMRAVLQMASGLLDAKYSVCGVGCSNLSRVAVVNGSYPGRWLDAYADERLYLYDPVVKYQMNFPSTVNWKNISRHYDDELSSAFFARANEYGLANGISSGIYSPTGRALSIFSFAGRSDSFGARYEKILETIVPHLNIALSRVKAI